jgi:hypothetical protein
MTEPTWYILYDGESVDGSGPPDYYTRTTDKEVAKEHWKKCKSNPYSTGKVVAYTDTKQIRIWWEQHWEGL